MSKDQQWGRAWGFRLLGILSLLLAPVFFLLFAMSGGSDCAGPAEECERISATFGFTALFFFILAGFSFWKVFGSANANSSKSDEAAE
jgi:hypothetical protein